MIYLIIIITITPTFSQYVATGLKPDVSFGEQNDRFDITNYLRHQKNYYKDNILDSQSNEYRRRGTNKKKHKSIDIQNKYESKRNYESGQKADTSKSKSWLELLNTNKGRKNIRKKIVKNLESHVNELANTIITKMRSMRRFDDFAYHDNMESGGGDTEDYKANLKKFDADFQNLKEDNLEIPSRRLQDIVDELHGFKQTRRVIPDPEKEILLHYAFPLDVKIEGFLQVP